MAMKSLDSTSLCALALLWAFATPSAVLAGEWVVREDPMGPGYIVTDDETGTIHTEGKRAANKIAKTLNKADDFYDPGYGPCHPPTSGMEC
jgi:hypothetical protein